MTLQNAPPGLDYERDKKFSKVRCSVDLCEDRIMSLELWWGK
jgi:hypothetical protein